jgi:uncharacterized protein YdeI (YjbR/CyaY-like superfamily)
MTPTFFESASAFRRWLTQHHGKARELLVGFHKRHSAKGGITYPEALDQSLCFGWIDGVRKSLGEDSYTIRFSPRKPGSVWSTVNTKRADELVERKLMMAAGLKAFRARDPEKSKQYSYEARSRPLGGVYLKTFKANEQAWAFFQAQPPGYRRVASWFVLSAKKEETRLRRLAVLMQKSERGQRLGLLAP